jgi:hypothetical protein
MSLEEKGAAMNKKNWSNILSVLARTTLAFVFVFGQTAWAGQDPKDKPDSNVAAKSQKAPRSLSPAAAAKAQPAEEKTAITENSPTEENSPRGGQHEGIKVHGHWSIEVRAPGGSVVRHVEFENSLDPGFSYSDPATGQVKVVPGGAALLSAVASNQWNIAPNWAVWLVGPSGLSKVLVATDSPCPLGACIITVGCAPSGGTNCNLSVTPLGTTPAFTGMSLTGSVTATQNGQISTVATLAYVTCPAFTPNCLPGGSGGASFTSSTNFPGAPISVSAGQTVAVTVNISFS